MPKERVLSPQEIMDRCEPWGEDALVKAIKILKDLSIDRYLEVKSGKDPVGMFLDHAVDYLGDQLKLSIGKVLYEHEPIAPWDVYSGRKQRW